MDGLHVLVYDLGAGHFDISIVTLSSEMWLVKATEGHDLCGSDFDHRMVEHFVQEFKQSTGNDISNNKTALHRLDVACEKSKRDLSSLTEATIELLSLVEGLDFRSSITREKFEELNSDLFLSTLERVTNALTCSGLRKEEIHEVILVGGCTRIPKIQGLVKEYFSGKSPNKSVNPEEIVAYGAAVEAAILYQMEDEETKSVKLVDVTPLSLGIKGAGGVMVIIIPRNTAIPTHYTEIFTAYTLDEPIVQIQVYEGERVMAADNNLLGEIVVVGVIPDDNGYATIEVTFDIDENGIMDVTADDKSTGHRHTIKIMNNKGGLTSEEFERMMNDAETFREEDSNKLQVILGKYKLESYCKSLKCEAESACRSGILTEEEKNNLIEKCNDTIRWVATSGDVSIDEIESRFKEINDIYQSLENQMRRSLIDGSKIYGCEECGS